MQQLVKRWAHQHHASHDLWCTCTSSSSLSLRWLMNLSLLHHDFIAFLFLALWMEVCWIFRCGTSSVPIKNVHSSTIRLGHVSDILLTHIVEGALGQGMRWSRTPPSWIYWQSPDGSCCSAVIAFLNASTRAVLLAEWGHLIQTMQVKNCTLHIWTVIVYRLPDAHQQLLVSEIPNVDLLHLSQSRLGQFSEGEILYRSPSHCYEDSFHNLLCSLNI